MECNAERVCIGNTKIVNLHERALIDRVRHTFKEINRFQIQIDYLIQLQGEIYSLSSRTYFVSFN